MLTDVRAFPADVPAFGLRPARVAAFGFAPAFVLAPMGMFFEGLNRKFTPDRADDPFALVLGAVAAEPVLALWLDR